MAEIEWADSPWKKTTVHDEISRRRAVEEEMRASALFGDWQTAQTGDPWDGWLFELRVNLDNETHELTPIRGRLRNVYTRAAEPWELLSNAGAILRHGVEKARGYQYFQPRSRYLGHPYDETLWEGWRTPDEGEASEEYPYGLIEWLGILNSPRVVRYPFATFGELAPTGEAQDG